MLRSSLLLGLLMQMLPRAALWERLVAFGPPGAGCRAFFSGRVALAAIAALPRFERRVVLLPEYLCNVVPLAFERAVWRVHGYAVDDRFELDAPALATRAAEIGAELLLLAPLFGADGGVTWWLSDDGRATRERLGLTLVLDLCQDAGALARLPPTLGRDWAALVSFNDKSFPGAMGALCWTDLDLPPPPPPGLVAALPMAARVLRRLLLPRRAGEERDFEFSYASRFPYSFDTAGPTRLQLALGLVGLQRLSRWQDLRRAAVAAGRVRPLDLPFAATAPFVVAAPGDPGRHRIKRPYATANDAAQSLRPRLVVRHNKGFDDE